MASVALTDQIKNDKVKINEVLITNLSHFCFMHKEEKNDLICINCTHSICIKCEKEHSKY